MAGKIIALHQQDPQAPSGRIAGDPHAVDPAADDEEVIVGPVQRHACSPGSPVERANVLLPAYAPCRGG